MRWRQTGDDGGSNEKGAIREHRVQVNFRQVGRKEAHGRWWGREGEGGRGREEQRSGVRGGAEAAERCGRQSQNARAAGVSAGRNASQSLRGRLSELQEGPAAPHTST